MVLWAAMGVVAYMSLKSQYPSGVQSIFDVLGSVFLHLLAYVGLTVLFFWSFLRRNSWGFFLAALFSVTYGFALEVAQLWVPGRSFSVGDIAVNILGATVAAAAIRMNGKRWNVKCER